MQLSRIGSAPRGLRRGDSLEALRLILSDPLLMYERPPVGGMRYSVDRMRADRSRTFPRPRRAPTLVARQGLGKTDRHSRCVPGSVMVAVVLSTKSRLPIFRYAGVPLVLLAAGCGSTGSAPTRDAGDAEASAADAWAPDTSSVLDGESGDSTVGDSGPTTSPSSEAGVLDCLVVNGDNCWKSTIAPAISCLPPKAARAVVSADGKTCTYDSGTVVAFSSPLFAPDASVSSFTVTTGGAVCVRYDQADSGLISSLTTSAGTVGLVGVYGQSLTLVCPDGGSYLGTVSTLAGCTSDIPGYTSAATSIGGQDGAAAASASMSMGVGGLGDAGQPTLYYCATP